MDPTDKRQQDVETTKLRNSQQTLWSGWQKGVAISCVCNIAVLICNVVLLIWARTKPMSTDGVYILWEGSQKSIETATTLLYLGLNFVSTILLAGSNYSLQVLVAPTRQDIDRAHHEKRSMDIGISSLHNWRYIHWQRKSLYVFLFVLSLPLHLFYNSTIFSVLAESRNTRNIIVTKDFLQTKPSNSSVIDIWHSALEGDQWIRMTNNDYLNFPKDEYSNALLFTNFSSSLRSSSTYCTTHYIWPDHENTTFLSYDPWLVPLNDSMISDFSFGFLALACCTRSDTCQQPFSTNFSSSTNLQIIDSTSISYYLVQTLYASSIELVPQLLITVIICSLLKIGGLALLLFAPFQPLVTIGDAVASFLDSPDPSTKAMGPLSVTDLRKRNPYQKSSCDLPSVQDKAWKTLKWRYFSAATPLRWWLTTGFCVLYLVVGMYLSFRFEGGGRASSLIGTILLTNLPQLLMSGVYLCYNALFTCMALSTEWTNFSEYRKGLRVSKPKGEQRETYFLSLPYRYSIPLIAKSMLLHWILSQSVQAIQMDIYGTQNSPVKVRLFRTISFWIIYALLPATGVLLSVAVGLGFRRFKFAMPLARSNSLVISAACHPVRNSEDLGSTDKLSIKKLQYGVIGEVPSGGYRVGFSDKEVMPLIPGEYYK